MALLLHILIALSSVGYATYVFFSPSKSKLRVSYGLVALTLGSGTYLVWSTKAPILQSCMSGLMYISAVSLIIAATYYKLARATK
ncbi:MAG: hypothetical protein AAB834_01840 [Patescibacteria group bacterium]